MGRRLNRHRAIIHRILQAEIVRRGYAVAKPGPSRQYLGNAPSLTRERRFCGSSVHQQFQAECRLVARLANSTNTRETLGRNGQISIMDLLWGIVRQSTACAPG
jgi:hypothetical protein